MSIYQNYKKMVWLISKQGTFRCKIRISEEQIKENYYIKKMDFSNKFVFAVQKKKVYRNYSQGEKTLLVLQLILNMHYQYRFDFLGYF